jgi:hypothetical protein
LADAARIEDSKTISLQPKDSPMAEAIENFERALRDGCKCAFDDMPRYAAVYSRDPRTQLR